MFQNVLTTLRQMGLKEKDAEVYLACLHFKEGLHVHEVVHETKLNRSTVDVALGRLIADGYINKVKVGNRYKYIAQSAEAIFFKQEELLGDFKNLLPLLSRLGAKKGETDIRFFEGKKGLERMYNDMLLKLKFAAKEDKQILTFAHGAKTLYAFPEVQYKFIDKRVKMGIWYRCIAPEGSVNVSTFTNDPKFLREVKTVPDAQFPFKVTMDAYADSVMIFSPQKPYGGVIIRNQNIADSVRALFHLVWNLLPDGQGAG